MQFCNPRQGNAVTGIWCLDNDCFNGPFKQDRFNKFLKRNESKRGSCLFLVMPDSIGDPVGTLKLWHEYAPQYIGWPLAFVAQDGQESMEYPAANEWSTLFIGGSTEWKMSEGAKQCVEYVQSLDKHIHIGRINSYKRFKHFADLEKSKEFTCDGTKQRFIGAEKAMAEYDSYIQKHRTHVGSRLPAGNSAG